MQQTWIPFTTDAFCQVLLTLVQRFLRRGFFNFVNVFHYFVIISPWKRLGPFIWTNLNPLHPCMLCAKFRCKLTQWFSRRFFNFVNVISLFRSYLSLEKGIHFVHLNKIEIPPPKDTCAKFGWNWLSGSGEED